MELRPIFDLEVLLDQTNMARSTYYYYQKSNQIDKYQVEKKLVEQIYHCHKGRYGYRRITLELRNRGLLINHKTVFRLMGQLGLKIS